MRNGELNHNSQEQEKEVQENNVPENLFVKVQKPPKVQIDRNKVNKQSDSILQNLLNASKVLEGRFTFKELINLDIPSFEAIINNEFANIDRSQEDFRERGIVTAYTKNEATDFDSSLLNKLDKATRTKKK